MISDIITQEQLLKDFKISKTYLRNPIIENKFPYYRIRRKKFFRLQEIEAFFDKNKSN